MDGYKLTGLARLYDAHYEYIYIYGFRRFLLGAVPISLGNKKKVVSFFLMLILI